MKIFSNKIKTETTFKQSRDYNRLKKIKIFNVFLILIVAGTLGTTFWFIYNDVYKTIGEIETMSIIKNIKSFEPINFKNYEDSLRSWEEKNSDSKTIEISRDLFNKTLIIPTSTPNIQKEGLPAKPTTSQSR